MPDIFVEPKKTKQHEHITQPQKDTSLSRRLGQQSAHLFATYCENPPGVFFETEDPDEKILLLVKRHFITNVPWIITALILALIPLALNIVFTITNAPFTLPERFITVFLLFYYLAIFGYAFINFITWFYNMTIVTQKRIVDIDFSDIVYHDVAQTKLTLVEDVNYTQSGFIRTFFNYGDVFVQTAGGKENIEALAIPKPAIMAQLVADFIGKGAHSG